MQLCCGQAARRWFKALPVGNSRMGAVAFGGLQREHLALTESSY